MQIRTDFDHAGGLPIFLEDLIKMWISQQKQIAAIVQGLQTYQSFSAGQSQNASYILYGMTEIAPPTVGGNLELWPGYFVGPNGEIIQVDQCNVPISTNVTNIYIEIEETVPTEGARTIEDTGANVNVLFERKGVIKVTPAYADLDPSVEAILIYSGTTRIVKTLAEQISDLINQ